MPERLTPDLCVIGGGIAGVAVAEAARRHGAQVVLVERAALGGAALRQGALPARALAAAGRRAQAIRSAASFGVGGGEPRISARGVFDYVQRVIAESAPALSAEQLRARGIVVIAASGRFRDARTLEADDTLIRARRFVLATGSRPLVPDIPGLGEVPYFTPRTIFDNPRKLTHLVIIGGGATALELGQALRRLGAGVTVVGSTVVEGHDPELVDLVLRRLADEGVALRPDALVTAIQPRSLGIGVLLQTPAGEETLDASHILVAGESAAELAGLAVEKAGIDLDPAGRLRLRHGALTTNRRVYAIGDVAGDMDAHGLGRRAERIAGHALFRRPLGTAADMPRLVFTDPEIASIGLDEAQARKRHPRFRLVRLALDENERARTSGEASGLARLIVEGDRLIGAGIAAPQAGEIIALIGFAIANRLTLRHFRHFAAPYPTLAEITLALAREAGRRNHPEKGLRPRLLALNRLLP